MGVSFATTVPSMIDADVIRKLRLNGSSPCSDGLAQALRWIGDRNVPLEQALTEARRELGPSNFEWASAALGISGYGSGDGYGYGDGDGYGSGDGYGYGDGYGSGYGDGYGSGDGYGYGADATPIRSLMEGGAT